jgi:hypothetical protein
VVAGAGGGLGDHLAGDEHALAGFTSDADYEVFACHGTSSFSVRKQTARRVRRERIQAGLVATLLSECR